MTNSPSSPDIAMVSAVFEYLNDNHRGWSMDTPANAVWLIGAAFEVRPRASQPATPTEGENAARDYEHGYNDGVEWVTVHERLSAGTELADKISDANLPAIDIYKTMIRVDPGYYVLLPSDLRDEVERALRGVAQAVPKPAEFDLGAYIDDNADDGR